MPRPHLTEVIKRRVTEFAKIVSENPDMIQGMRIESDLDFDTSLEAGGTAELAALLKITLDRDRRGQHELIHILIHVPTWLRKDMSGGDVAGLLQAVKSKEEETLLA